jgi:hypothetical protein
MLLFNFLKFSINNKMWHNKLINPHYSKNLFTFSSRSIVVIIFILATFLVIVVVKNSNWSLEIDILDPKTI